MKYILKVSNQAFVIVDTFTITSDYEKATQFDSIGEAMKKAAELNKQLENNIIKVMSL